MGKHDPDDPVTMYIREASNVEPLTKEEETNLFRRLARVGDWGEERENVARRLVESQLALVASIAQKYWASGVPMLDLIEEGNIGLMDAVRSFAEKPIGNFTAHAAACIEEAIAKVLGKSKLRSLAIYRHYTSNLQKDAR